MQVKQSSGNKNDYFSSWISSLTWLITQSHKQLSWYSAEDGARMGQSGHDYFHCCLEKHNQSYFSDDL